MFDKRKSGVLFHISSLPSPYGIGVLGGSIYNFIDKLSEMGFSYWQVLPINGVDLHGSPYCSASAFAGNYIFIDPHALLEMGLVSEKDTDKNIYTSSPYTANYDFAHKTRYELLKTAFNNITENIKEEVRNFVNNNPWLPDCALYMAIKEANNCAPWYKWDKDLAIFSNAKRHSSDFKEETSFWCFVQYIFFLQWKKIRKYANEKGIKIIGDMPFYVSYDSADVWSNIDLFDIDKDDFHQKSEAGVPPDYFSETGQLWGNPIYNWNNMENNKFKWWIDRISLSLSLFDCVRIDHFRAFASYYQIPFGAKTAKEGEWKTGVGEKFFDEVFKNFPNAPIIAENLGECGDDVRALLEYTKFPGMNVIQFAFDTHSDSQHLPHNVEKNSIYYVGTHDNNTILGWLWEANADERQFALDYVGFDDKDWGQGGAHSKSCRRITEAVWKSCANTVIIPFQDMCGFGSDARMNKPGTVDNNWLFRTTDDVINSIDKDYYLKINNIYRRM